MCKINLGIYFSLLVKFLSLYFVPEMRFTFRPDERERGTKFNVELCAIMVGKDCMWISEATNEIPKGSGSLYGSFEYLFLS